MSPCGFSVILVPTDRHEPPREAIEVARTLARDGARLIVACVGEETDVVPCACQATATAGPSLSLEIIRRRGPVAETLIALAEELGCELIVIGDDDRSGDEQRVMGGVAQQLLHQAACPVLCLPVAPHATPHSPPYPPPHGSFAEPAPAPGI